MQPIVVNMDPNFTALITEVHNLWTSISNPFMDPHDFGNHVFPNLRYIINTPDTRKDLYNLLFQRLTISELKRMRLTYVCSSWPFMRRHSMDQRL